MSAAAITKIVKHFDGHYLELEVPVLTSSDLQVLSHMMVWESFFTIIIMKA
jgi:hypothetical protein